MLTAQQTKTLQNWLNQALEAIQQLSTQKPQLAADIWALLVMRFDPDHDPESFKALLAKCQFALKGEGYQNISSAIDHCFELYNQLLHPTFLKVDDKVFNQPIYAPVYATALQQTATGTYKHSALTLITQLAEAADLRDAATLWQIFHTSFTHLRHLQGQFTASLTTQTGAQAVPNRSLTKPPATKDQFELPTAYVWIHHNPEAPAEHWQVIVERQDNDDTYVQLLQAKIRDEKAKPDKANELSIIASDDAITTIDAENNIDAAKALYAKANMVLFYTTGEALRSDLSAAIEAYSALRQQQHPKLKLAMGLFDYRNQSIAIKPIKLTALNDAVISDTVAMTDERTCKRATYNVLVMLQDTYAKPQAQPTSSSAPSLTK